MLKSCKIGLLTVIILSFLLNFCSNKSNKENRESTNFSEKTRADSIDILKKEKDNQAGILTGHADSLFLNNEFAKAQESYLKAISLKNDTSGVEYLKARIKECEKKIAYENSPIGKAEKKLLGKKAFGIQFIWDGYSFAEIYLDGDVIKIKGNQFSKDKSEYCKIEGKLDFKDEKQFIFNGHITIYTHDCCGVIDTTGKFTFRKTGNRKYWRLKEFDNLCSMYTCAYYLDIFE